MAFQVFRQNAESVGSAVACAISLLLYEEVDPLAPFFVTTAFSVLALIVFTVSFCRRDGFGIPLEEAEARRAQRRGLKRVSSWAAERPNAAKQILPNVAEEEEPEQP